MAATTEKQLSSTRLATNKFTSGQKSSRKWALLALRIAEGNERKTKLHAHNWKKLKSRLSVSSMNCT